MGTQNETGKKVQLFVNCEFVFVLFSFVLFCYSSGWLRPPVLLAANHILKANSIKNKMQSNCQGGLSNVSAREMKSFFNHEKSSCTKKIPSGRERKEGFETSEIFFLNPPKRYNKDSSGFVIDMKWKLPLLTMCLESTGSAGFPLAAISLLASGIRIKPCLCTNNFTIPGVAAWSFHPVLLLEDEICQKPHRKLQKDTLSGESQFGGFKRSRAMSAGLHRGIFCLIAHCRKLRPEIQEEFKFNRRINGYRDSIPRFHCRSTRVLTSTNQRDTSS